MPVIREYQSQVMPAGEMGGRRASSADTDRLGPGLQQLGDTLSRIGEHIGQVRQDALLTATASKAAGELQTYSDYLQHGRLNPDGSIDAPPDPGEHFGLYQQKAKEIEDRIKGELGDGATFGKFQREYAGMVVREGLQVRQAALNKQKAFATAELDTTIDDLANVAARGDEFVKSLVAEKLSGTVDRYVKAGVLTPEEGKKRMDKFGGILDTAQLREDIRRDPGVAIVGLLGDQYKSLQPDQREKWIDIASREADRQTRAQAAAQEQMRIQQERAQKELEETTAKAGYALAAQGRLPTAWVDANFNNLSKADYKALLDEASGRGPRSTNPDVYAPLRIAAGRGDTSVIQKAKDAYLRGDLTTENYNGLVSEVESHSDPTKGPSWYKQGNQFIDRFTTPDEVNPKAGARQRQAEALEEWRKWKDTHLDASEAEAEKAYRRIAEQALLIDQINLGKLRPTYQVLRPEGKGTAEDFAATWKATQDAFSRGEIDKFALEREAQLINERRKIQEKLNQLNPPKQQGAK